MATGSAAPARVATRSSGSSSDTRERGGTLRVRNTGPPMTLSHFSLYPLRALLCRFYRCFAF
jgi:hypothetical protein